MTSNLKLVIILGTRPEIIKLSPIIRTCIKYNINYSLIHTGQHYSPELNEHIFNDLNLPKPEYNLHIGSASHGEQTGRMLIGIEPILKKEQPNAVIVLGDPNSAFAGAVAAAKLNIPVCHIEAGRRSFDKTMPEEVNRVVIDHISDVLFTPNEITRQNLLCEGISESQIVVCGDTNVDAITENKQVAKRKSTILERFNLAERKFFLATIHRPENVANVNNLKSILSAFKKLSVEYQLPFVFPVHPRTQKMIDELSLNTDGLILTQPLGYLDFLQLEMNCTVLLTDSGSLQEEACILQIPCVTIRNDTERPETISLGANILVKADVDAIMQGVESIYDSTRDWANPFGTAGVSELIIHEIQQTYLKSE